MSDLPAVTLEQWRALLAVVDEGGYAQAAARLHKSQSSITYAVQKLEELLSVAAFELKGRKAELTPTGRLLVRRARGLVEDALELERAAQKVSAGWEAEIRLAVEMPFPNRLLLRALQDFAKESPHTRIEVFETVITGSPVALTEQGIDLAVVPRVPAGLLAEPLMRLRFIPAAHPQHPLHVLGRELTMRDLRKHRHLVVRDTARRGEHDASQVEAAQRWTFSSMSTSIQAASAGHGYAWYPEDKILDELTSGKLKPLPLRGGAERWLELYLLFADRDAAGPGTLRLAEILRGLVHEGCKAVAQAELAVLASPPAHKARERTRKVRANGSRHGKARAVGKSGRR
jgi:DNA-binding transcriptional LysR family regulator